MVKATEKLHERGQSLWLDNITRGMLDNDAWNELLDRVQARTSAVA